MNSRDYVEDNFDCHILDRDSDLWYDVMGSNLLDGWTYDIIRFKVPEYYVQTGFNKVHYRGFILYSRVAEWDESDPQHMVLQDNAVIDQDQVNWFFRNTVRFWFCSCRNGSR